jgi:hypothetical protein
LNIAYSRVSWIGVMSEALRTDPALSLRVQRLLIEDRSQFPILSVPHPIANAVHAAWFRFDLRVRAIGA